MSWDHVVLFILAAFGAATLLLSQVRDVLVKLLEVIEAWQQVQAGLRRPSRRTRRGPAIAHAERSATAVEPPSQRQP
jgi:hypothetical protein